MIPFCSAAGISFQMIKMLVELVLCPLTFIGAAEGSEIYKLRSVIFHDYGTWPVSKELPKLIMNKDKALTRLRIPSVQTVKSNQDWRTCTGLVF